MTKLAISGTLFSVLIAFNVQAADKPLAPSPAAPVAAKEAPAKAGAPAAPASAPAPGAAASAPMGPPKPSPEVDALYKPYEGNWKCDTTFQAGAFGPGSPGMTAKTEVKIKRDPSGFWYRGEYKMKKTKSTPEMGGMFLLGYDEAAKAPVNLNFDNMGGYAVEHASGATAEKIPFVGDGSMMGMKVKFRETMSQKDSKTIEHEFSADMGKGFQPLGLDVCKK